MWVSSYCLSISDVYCWWVFAMGSVPALDIGNRQTIAGDPYRTAASRHTLAEHPRIAHITDNPPTPHAP